MSLQSDTLTALRERGPMSNAEARAALGMEMGTGTSRRMSWALNDLCAHGHADRIPSDGIQPQRYRARPTKNPSNVTPVTESMRRNLFAEASTLLTHTAPGRLPIDQHERLLSLIARAQA